MIKSHTSTTSALNEVQSNITKGKNSSKYQIIEE
jgi:hypothetical protein